MAALGDRLYGRALRVQTRAQAHRILGSNWKFDGNFVGDMPSIVVGDRRLVFRDHNEQGRFFREIVECRRCKTPDVDLGRRITSRQDLETSPHRAYLCWDCHVATAPQDVSHTNGHTPHVPADDTPVDEPPPVLSLPPLPNGSSAPRERFDHQSITESLLTSVRKLREASVEPPPIPATRDPEN